MSLTCGGAYLYFEYEKAEYGTTGMLLQRNAGRIMADAAAISVQAIKGEGFTSLIK
ncbi:hypothetical protein VNF293_31950 [Atlantibacter hermannii]